MASFFKCSTWATPRLVSLKGLIIIFQQASPHLSYGSPPPPPKKKPGIVIIRGKPWVSTLCFLFAVSLRPGHMRHLWCVTSIMHCAQSTVTCLPFRLNALVLFLHAMAVRKVALPVDESAHSEQACDCKYYFTLYFRVWLFKPGPSQFFLWCEFCKLNVRCTSSKIEVQHLRWYSLWQFLRIVFACLNAIFFKWNFHWSWRN